MDLLEILKIFILGVVEGITEWLPISSTGHMLLVDEFIKLNMSEAFKEMFVVVVQLGAIMAVVVLYWKKLLPFSFENGVKLDVPKIRLWFKILFACIPAAIIGLIFDDYIKAIFFNYQTIASMLILYGILFIYVENRNKGLKPKCNSLNKLSYKTAFLIGIFQLLALIPGTSRSGATIVGGMLLGVSRTVAAEFTFFLAIPVMFGASLLEVIKFGFNFTGNEVFMLLFGMAVAFVVSILSIKFLMEYIKKHDFKPFGWYRIIVGVVVLAYFFINTNLIK